jgi:hypothetical protein
METSLSSTIHGGLEGADGIVCSSTGARTKIFSGPLLSSTSIKKPLDFGRDMTGWTM